MSEKSLLNIKSSLTLGTQQRNRFFEALDGDYVKIDERSFEDLLVYTSRLSKLINFYGPDNRIKGDWSHFFSDETVILSSIILSNPNEIEKRFKTYIKRVSLFKQEAKRKKYLYRCCLEIYRFAKDFNHWYVRLKEVETFTNSQLAVKGEIESAITSKLANSLENFRALYVDHLELDQEELDFSIFDDVWELNRGGEVSSAEEKEAVVVLEELQVVFQNFYETLLYLKTKTPVFLDHSMTSDVHYPEVALFLAFLKLYGHTQDNINGLIDKHIKFYYQEVLQQTTNNHKLDKVYIQIELDSEAKPTLIPEDTRFSGVDSVSGEDVYYLADESLSANQAKVQKIYSLYVDKSIVSKRRKSALRVNNIYFSDLPLESTLSSRSNQENVTEDVVALFGEDQSYKGVDEKTMENASIGFALSSPVLYLQGGHREVHVTLSFDSKSYDQMINVLKNLSEIAEDEKEEHRKVESFFVKAFTDSFNLMLTSETGWHEVNKYIVKKNVKEKSLTFSFDLDSSVEGIVAYDEEIHGENFKTNLPILKFNLNPNSFVYGYTFMSHLILDQVSFKVGVRKLKKLQLFNNIGRLSPDSPFLPFGPTPKKGAYFVIGNSEVFNKSLDDICLNIDWFDLPNVKGGFKEHYQEYKMDVDNASFEVALSILDGGGWKPENPNDQQLIKVFRTEKGGEFDAPKADDTLLRSTVIRNIDMKRVKQSPSYKDIGEVANLTSTTQRGFFKLELTNPLLGFGHGAYQAVLSEAIMENAKGGLIKSSKKVPMPSAPYAPQIKSISLDYESSSVISLKDATDKIDEGNGQLFHIHPFGIHKRYPNPKSQDRYVVPHYDFEGAAYIGLEGLNPPEQVSVLFDMVDEFTESSEEGIPQLDWDYLIDDEWKSLSTSRILRDDTNGFLKTGIIVISLPGDITSDNQILGEGKFWLRVSVRKNLTTISALRSMATNVMTATLQNIDKLGPDYLRERLDKYSITRTVHHINGVRSVIQPLPSFEGRPAESKNQFYTRVGERLRHRGRAITAWDYERITLEEFPEVNHATCLSNMNSKDTDLPGSVLLVVSPTKEFSASSTEPMASSELLMKIKSTIMKYTSPFVNIEVRNPTYERIKIICAVKFVEGHNHGFYIQKLNEDINQYLRGTLLSQSKKIGLGGAIHISDILSYIRTLTYVDFITKFSMIQVARDVHGNYVLVDTAREGEQSGALKATKPWSILVPAPEHQISVLIDSVEVRSKQAGIDYLELGQDFIIED